MRTTADRDNCRGALLIGLLICLSACTGTRTQTTAEPPAEPTPAQEPVVLIDLPDPDEYPTCEPIESGNCTVEQDGQAFRQFAFESADPPLCEDPSADVEEYRLFWERPFDPAIYVRIGQRGGAPKMRGIRWGDGLWLPDIDETRLMGNEDWSRVRVAADSASLWSLPMPRTDLPVRAGDMGLWHIEARRGSEYVVAACWGLEGPANERLSAVGLALLEAVGLRPTDPRAVY